MHISHGIQVYSAIDASKFHSADRGEDVPRTELPPVNEADESPASQSNSYSPGDPPVLPTDNKSSDPSGASGGAGPTAAPSSGRASQETEQASSGADDQAEQRAQERADAVVISQLKARDQEVRVHEAAHAAVGGKYAGSPSLQFTRGPDGVNYATSGEVRISTGKVAGDPQATIEKARVIRSAALAPASPSVQDRRVAAQASQLEADARVELREVKAEETKQKEAEAVEEEGPVAEVLEGAKQAAEIDTKDEAEESEKLSDSPSEPEGRSDQPNVTAKETFEEIFVTTQPDAEENEGVSSSNDGAPFYQIA
ncbi:hypothetical protein A9Q99_07895 [Gammaproteobacteria bacterium 45_16_T64]|nr:hypothetical protein A9Q99_07895 [Gammaproteobacteria bacterium 45_16_T64]